MWCLGDLVGRTGSAATLKLAQASCTVVLAGNHDLVVAGRLPEAYVATHGGAGILSIRAELDEQEMAALATLPTEHLGIGLHAAHAALDHPTDHVEDRFDADTQLALADRRYLALGHAHRAFCFTGEEGCWIVEPDRCVELGGSALVSPGSVRSTDVRQGTICVLDTTADTCHWHRVGATIVTVPATTAGPTPHPRKGYEPTAEQPK